MWLGYLQLHYKTKGGHPNDPILQDFHNITVMDAVLTSDGAPLPHIAQGADGKRIETYPNARRPDWPEAEFIVGNPPFIGGSGLLSAFGNAYATSLRTAHPQINDSADFVMYWWDRAAELLTAVRCHR